MGINLDAHYGVPFNRPPDGWVVERRFGLTWRRLRQFTRYGPGRFAHGYGYLIRRSRHGNVYPRRGLAIREMHRVQSDNPAGHYRVVPLWWLW